MGFCYGWAMESMTRKRSLLGGGLRLGVLLLGMVAALGIAISSMMGKPDLSLLRPLEGPSGWQHYSKAMELLPEGVDYGGTNLVELAAKLEAARPALDELRLGLELPNQMPGDQESVDKLIRLRTFKALGAALGASSRLSAARGDWTNAVARAREMVRFGQEFSRGVVIHAMMGISVENAGVRQLVSLVGSLDGAALEEVAAWLRKTERRAEPWEKIMARERSFMNASAQNWLHKMAGKYAAWKGKLFEEVEGRRRASLVEGRLAQVFVAIRRHELEHGRAPATLAELVPALLPEIPGDMLGAGPLKAVAKDGRLVVYSVGPDGVDNQGTGDDILPTPASSPASREKAKR
jgi:hypothetical protein